MRSDISEYLGDIKEATEAIQEHIQGMDFADYVSDRKTKSAVERELLIISEACIKIDTSEGRRRVENDLRLETRFPVVRWHSVRGIGNFLRHEYAAGDNMTIWKIITGSELANLRAAVSEALAKP